MSTREQQLLKAEIERLEHVRPSSEPTVQRAIEDRIVKLKHQLEMLPVLNWVEGHDA